jgi:DNA-binding NarL/FixJ family response regulator
MDGEEVAAIVRRDHPELPIIALSGFVSDIPAGFQERVDAFVSKGSPPEQLLRALEKALGYRPAPQLKPDPEVIGHSLEHASQVREHVDRARLHVERTRKVAAETRERVARGSAQKKRPA